MHIESKFAEPALEPARKTVAENIRAHVHGIAREVCGIFRRNGNAFFGRNSLLYRGHGIRIERVREIKQKPTRQWAQKLPREAQGLVQVRGRGVEGTTELDEHRDWGHGEAGAAGDDAAFGLVQLGLVR